MINCCFCSLFLLVAPRSLTLARLKIKAPSSQTKNTKNENNNIGADYHCQTLIDFDWYNPHPYHRTTETIKKIFDVPIFIHQIKNHTRTMHKRTKRGIYKSTLPQTKNLTSTQLDYKRHCTTNYVNIIDEIEKYHYQLCRHIARP